MTDKCRQFEESILELVYEELSESVADELRMHASKCPSCREVLEGMLLTRKLTAQLPMAEPGDELDAAILGAAAKQAEQNVVDTTSLVRETENSNNPREHVIQSPGIWDWLRSIILRPAFATATVVVLVCVVTIYITEGSSSPDQQENNLYKMPAPVSTADESPEGKTEEKLAELEESAEKDGTKQLEHLGYLEGEKTGELHDKEQKVATLEPMKRKAKSASRAASGQGRGLGKSDLDDTYNLPGKPKAVLSKDEKSANEPLPATDSLLGGDFARPPPSTVASSGPAITGSASGGLTSQVRETEQESVAAAPQAASEEIVDQVTTADAEMPSTSFDFEKGLDAYSRGDCKNAVTYFQNVLAQSTTSTSSKASAIHNIAKCEKRRGKFASAASWYDRLLNQYSTYNQRPEALFEAANCHSRLGQTSRARERLGELLDFPAWRDRAQRELNRLAE